MQHRISADLIGGLVLLIAGAAVAIYSNSNYELGSITRMGPGMFPFALGVVLAGLGALLGVGGWFRHTETEEAFSVRGFLGVLAAVATFALLARPFGVLPGVMATCIVSSLADKKLKIHQVILLALALALLSWVIFDQLLSIPFVMLRWPF